MSAPESLANPARCVTKVLALRHKINYYVQAPLALIVCGLSLLGHFTSLYRWSESQGGAKD